MPELAALAFEALLRTGWWLGALMGLVQGLFVLAVAMRSIRWSAGPASGYASSAWLTRH